MEESFLRRAYYFSCTSCHNAGSEHPVLQVQVMQLKMSRDKLLSEVNIQFAEAERLGNESSALTQVSHHNRQASVEAPGIQWSTCNYCIEERRELVCYSRKNHDNQVKYFCVDCLTGSTDIQLG